MNHRTDLSAHTTRTLHRLSARVRKTEFKTPAQEYNAEKRRIKGRAFDEGLKAHGKMIEDSQANKGLLSGAAIGGTIGSLLARRRGRGIGKGLLAGIAIGGTAGNTVGANVRKKKKE